MAAGESLSFVSFFETDVTDSFISCSMLKSARLEGPAGSAPSRREASRPQHKAQRTGLANLLRKGRRGPRRAGNSDSFDFSMFIALIRSTKKEIGRASCRERV